MSATHTAVLGLNDATVNKLRELRRLCVDSSKGFDECAELIKSPSLKELFLRLAEERRRMDQELENQIEWNDQAEEEEGSYLAAWHRAWIKARDAVSSDSDAVLLSEAERGEDVIKQAYEEALQETAGSPIQPIVHKQYDAVKAAHDRVRDLRDAANA